MNPFVFLFIALASYLALIYYSHQKRMAAVSKNNMDEVALRDYAENVWYQINKYVGLLLPLDLKSIHQTPSCEDYAQSLNSKGTKRSWDFEEFCFDSPFESGVTVEEILTFEKTLAITLPDDFLAFYEKHNGQKSDYPVLFDGQELLSFTRIMEEWTMLNTILNENITSFEVVADLGVKNNWWNPKWIPILTDRNGNYTCMDLDPEPGGKMGQLISFDHETIHREIVISSFLEFMDSYLGDLKQGNLIYNEDYGGVMLKV
ncbi:MAG: hypothetical protein RLZZ70_273 [Candidatus Parcubacteria bacterium]|jgi:cell wall assembly regulator SMI1